MKIVFITVLFPILFLFSNVAIAEDEHADGAALTAPTRAVEDEDMRTAENQVQRQIAGEAINFNEVTGTLDRAFPNVIGEVDSPEALFPAERN